MNGVITKRGQVRYDPEIRIPDVTLYKYVKQQTESISGVYINPVPVHVYTFIKQCLQQGVSSLPFRVHNLFP